MSPNEINLLKGDMKMFVNFIATRNHHVFRMVHVWTRVQQTKIYEALQDVPSTMI